MDSSIHKTPSNESLEDSSSSHFLVEHGHSYLDTLSITNCINSFLLYLDQGESAHFANLFTENAELTLATMGSKRTGREELASFCIATHQKFPNTIHVESNMVIEYESATTATNKSYWQAIQEGQIIAYGIHEDILKKQLKGIRPYQGTWLFQERKITHLWRKSA